MLRIVIITPGVSNSLTACSLNPYHSWSPLQHILVMAWWYWHFIHTLSVTMILTMRFQLLLSSINQVKAVTVWPNCSAPYGTEPSMDMCWRYLSILWLLVWRGVYGYQLPKWLAKINLEIDNHNTKADITATDGTPDLMLDITLPALKTITSESLIRTNKTINKIDGNWYQVTV